MSLGTTQRRALDGVRRAVREHGLWQPGQRVLLACSGGADSLGALELLRRLRRTLGHGLAVGHIDHGLWQGSATAAAQVAQHAQQLGLPVAMRRLQLSDGADLEARARAARYQALAELAAELNCAVVATAHHADDQAETLLLRLARGAGVDALAGIRRRRDDDVVRPFLGLRRAELRAWAPAHAVVEDPSNQDPRFARNALRLQVMPALAEALPGAVAGLARTAGVLAAHEGELTRWRDRVLEARWRQGVLNLAGLSLEPADASELLRFLADRVGAPAPGQRAMSLLAQLLTRPRGELRCHQLIVLKDGDLLRAMRPEVARPQGADYLADGGDAPLGRSAPPQE